eukprot:c20098_g1_i3 orf=626-1351(-)
MATLVRSNHQLCSPLHGLRKAPCLPLQTLFFKPSSRSSTLFALRASLEDTSSSASSSPSSSLDVSVFRFTLGIPGFNDSDLPRVLGIAFGAVLLLNHFLTADYVTAAQWRSELIGLCNAAISISLPTLGRSLNGGTPINTATSMPKSRQIFTLSNNLLPEEKEDLAWGSYALLKNTKTTSLVIWNEELVCARGFWDVPQEAQGEVSEWLEKMLKNSSLFTSNTLTYVPFKAGKGVRFCPAS